MGVFPPVQKIVWFIFIYSMIFCLRLCFGICGVVAWRVRPFLSIVNLGPHSISIVFVKRGGGIGVTFFLIRKGRRRKSLALRVGWYDFAATGAGDEVVGCNESELIIAAEGERWKIHDE